MIIAHFCSARLQAGICMFSKCPPEGGRYMNQFVACHGTGAPVGVIRHIRNSVSCKYPRVGHSLLERSATKRDKEYHA
jgi:hypothetical protein